jgi:peptidoglycan/xylan/chitin deacetylase (PgdA/CDA1 family)
MKIVDAYYQLKPLIPRRVQIMLRSAMILRKRFACRDVWPIDERAGMVPPGWSGWPCGKQFALVLTHDVDTAKGHAQCEQLMELERRLKFYSSFNFVPERYTVSSELRKLLETNGFEVGVHGLRHDGNLFASKEKFQEESAHINRYLKEWRSVGFRSPCMYHNLEWIADLDIEYDASTFDTDPFEPQPDGVTTIFPFLVSRGSDHKEYVELPYTLPQDFTLFILMKEKTINIWKRKLDWIAEHGGMVLVNTHPDYMCFDDKRPKLEEYPSRLYEEFLYYIRTRYEGKYWHALPKDVSRFWVKDMPCINRHEIVGCSPES